MFENEQIQFPDTIRFILLEVSKITTQTNTSKQHT
jgi:hypothetical protein